MVWYLCLPAFSVVKKKQPGVQPQDTCREPPRKCDFMTSSMFCTWQVGLWFHVSCEVSPAPGEELITPNVTDMTFSKFFFLHFGRSNKHVTHLGYYQHLLM